MRQSTSKSSYTGPYQAESIIQFLWKIMKNDCLLHIYRKGNKWLNLSRVIEPNRIHLSLFPQDFYMQII